MQSSKFVEWGARVTVATLLVSGFQVVSAQVNDPPPVPVKPTSEYISFLEKFPEAEKVDVFYFVKNFPEFKNKVIMLDARFRRRISFDMIFAKIWRNFGTLTLIVTDIPKRETIPDDQPFLLVGRMTGYKNEVIDGKLESMPIVKFMGKYVCKDFRCNQ